VDESKEFLRWLDQDHFTILGYREYRFRRRGKQLVADVVPQVDLGLLRRSLPADRQAVRDYATVPTEMIQSSAPPRLVRIGKGPHRATVHRNVYVDVVSVRQFDAKGHVTAEQVFIGLLTASAYNASPRSVPLLRGRVDRALEAAGVQANSHDGRALLHILETFPRDDLFQISDQDLYAVTSGILQLRDRTRTSLFLWRDPLQRCVSCLVFVPLDRHHTVLRQRIQRLLEDSFGGVCRSFDTRIDQGTETARIHFVIEAGSDAPSCDVAELEQRVAEAARSWSDRLQAALVATTDAQDGVRLLGRYGDAFDGAYQQTYDARMAVEDIKYIEQALGEASPALQLYRRPDQLPHELRLRVYRPEQSVVLSDALPILENLGFRVIDERPFVAQPRGAAQVWIHDFGLAHRDRADVALDAVGAGLTEALRRVWFGQMEDDAFNRLVVNPGLSWRQVTLLRAYAKFLRQAQIPFSESYMQAALAAHPQLAAQIVALFEARCDPRRPSDAETVDAVRQSIQQELDAVKSLDEDRIIGYFVTSVEATLRTNYYQSAAAGESQPRVVLKLASPALSFLPRPRPMVEVFVYSPAMEGVHLRFGLVARGGLRWSDRREDFRTEILGLVKAQQVKNSVIVPVGSKGGFVVKRPPGDSSRDAQLQAGVACYRTFIRGLLDVTDNYRNGEAVHPADVVCHDGYDPYLVVAADKGTAAFSDVANAVAADYGFWLDDAFASGGSAGYDHKEMGITARGAWESVKRHFRELDRDVQQQDFTVIGVGDMSGDVFGNGMLQSKHIRLLAAFNHLHIFVDPDPDAARSYRERQRLFNLPRSSWADYDPAVLSAGGAVYERSAKWVTLSSAVKKWLGVSKAKITPPALIQAILRAPADLLFFGGIGTYVKARRETDLEVGDRANDALRVNGDEINATVVAEGANLGVTQRGRVEYALKGGRLNVDAVDNSAGVDCSDHEVNIKILLNAIERDGQITREQRNALLEQMTDDVARLVLRDNYLQTGRLSITGFHERHLADRLAGFMRALERAGHLDRAIEFLPDDDTLVERKARDQGFTRPELCILMAYAKIVLFDQLIDSTFLTEPCMGTELADYFPALLRERYRAWMPRHRLRREIIATMSTNLMVNRVGITFAHELQERTGKKACDVARAYTVASTIFDMEELWGAIDALDNQSPARVQAAMHWETSRLMEHATHWLLTYCPHPLDIAGSIQTYAQGVRRIAAALETSLGDAEMRQLGDQTQQLVDRGVPSPLARRVAQLPRMASACDIVRISHEARSDVIRSAQVYFAVGTRLDIDWLRGAAAAMPANSRWDSHATTAIVDDLYQCQFLLARQLMRQAEPGEEPAAILERCCATHRAAYMATTQLMTEIRQSGTLDLAMLAVASRQLRTLISA